ncbi:nuclear transport factor 2 family protein [Streptomyces sp. NPDC051172]|uniref:YybH family protein n=1 Tax=Streptomyces sp. NPDC051172 TaxID=3155796 RepID=UPI003441C301
MPDDAAQIRALITKWAESVHRGDLDGVLADHTEDIVMYDVPPPHEGLHGLAAYRATRPPFFARQAQGACFDIEFLDVTAGKDAACAHALLRCGTPGEPAEHPTLRLRLTLGLRKERGRRLVAQEHHSFPHD